MIMRVRVTDQAKFLFFYFLRSSKTTAFTNAKYANSGIATTATTTAGNSNTARAVRASPANGYRQYMDYSSTTSSSSIISSAICTARATTTIVEQSQPSQQQQQQSLSPPLTGYITFRLAKLTDVPQIQSCNLATLPENYSPHFYSTHLKRWPDLAIVAEHTPHVVPVVECFDENINLSSSPSSALSSSSSFPSFTKSNTAATTATSQSTSILNRWFRRSPLSSIYSSSSLSSSSSSSSSSSLSSLLSLPTTTTASSSISSSQQPQQQPTIIGYVLGKCDLSRIQTYPVDISINHSTTSNDDTTTTTINNDCQLMKTMVRNNKNKRQPLYERTGHVTSLAILQPYRRHGLAAQLMQQLHYNLQHGSQTLPNSSLRGNGGGGPAVNVALHVRVSNMGAKKLYMEGLGYRIRDVMRDYYQDGEDAFLMQKILETEEEEEKNLVDILSVLEDDDNKGIMMDEEENEASTTDTFTERTRRGLGRLIGANVMTRGMRQRQRQLSTSSTDINAIAITSPTTTTTIGGNVPNHMFSLPRRVYIDSSNNNEKVEDGENNNKNGVVVVN